MQRELEKNRLKVLHKNTAIANNSIGKMHKLLRIIEGEVDKAIIITSSQ